MSTPDLSEFEALTTTRKRECAIRTALTELDEQASAELALALTRRRISHAAIVKWLGKRHHPCSKDTVGRHRRGECSCPTRAAEETPDARP